MENESEQIAVDPVVVLAADEAFAMPLAVTVRSALDNLAPDCNLQLYILDGGFTPKTRDRLVDSWKGSGRYDLHWVAVDDSALKGLKVTGHVSIAAYFRILLPQLLPNDIKRLLYLDSDLLILANLGDLWKNELGENICLAGQDLYGPYLDSSQVLKDFLPASWYIAKGLVKNYQEFGFTPDMPYLNSGLLLLDLEAWRELDLTSQLLNCLREHEKHVLYWDQYALNVVFARRWGILDPRWNQGANIYTIPHWSLSHLDKRTFHAVLTDPYIVHFTSWDKPWTTECRHPWRKEFFKYLDRTAWAGWRPPRFESWPKWWRFQMDRMYKASRRLYYRYRHTW